MILFFHSIRTYSGFLVTQSMYVFVLIKIEHRTLFESIHFFSKISRAFDSLTSGREEKKELARKEPLASTKRKKKIEKNLFSDFHFKFEFGFSHVDFVNFVFG